MQALVQVEREIRATDQQSKRKYLREFSDAFQEYQQVLSPAELDRELLSADIVLIGDYHALWASQRFAAKVVQQIAAAGRPVVLGVETIFSRDQHILDEWQAGEIDSEELRERIRFDFDWGYDWQPFCELLQAARAANAKVLGLDCMPRGDLRRIGARDRHAADQVAEARAVHPQAAIVVLFGESHLAPQHLPELVNAKLPLNRTLTVLQNVDSLYWHAAGERSERVDAVRVSDNVVCVFTSTPLEKYESYRLCIERWRCERPSRPDFAPTIYNLVDTLQRFLNIAKYAHVGTDRPKLLVDMLPEICSRSTVAGLRKVLLKKRAGDEEVREVLLRVEKYGCCYVTRLNVIFLLIFQMPQAAEAAAHFLHAACSGAMGRARWQPARVDSASLSADDLFYARCVEVALGYFGSRVLAPGRPAVKEQDLYTLYAQSPAEIEDQSRFGYRDYMRMIDLIVQHKDFESNARKYWETPELIEEGRRYTGEHFEFVTGQLGAMLGSELYDAYVSGRVHKRFIRSLFFRDLERTGAAHALYFAMARRTRKQKRLWVA